MFGFFFFIIKLDSSFLFVSADVPQHRVFKNEEVLTEVKPELPQMKEEPELVNVTEEEEEGFPRQDEEQPGTGTFTPPGRTLKALRTCGFCF